MYVKTVCLDCGYEKIRYHNVLKCGKCGSYKIRKFARTLDALPDSGGKKHESNLLKICKVILRSADLHEKSYECDEESWDAGKYKMSIMDSTRKACKDLEVQEEFFFFFLIALESCLSDIINFANHYLEHGSLDGLFVDSTDDIYVKFDRHLFDRHLK